jgi:tRNA-modifying protein YgfZ
MISQVSLDGYHAARTRAAVLDRSDRGRLLLSGRDRRSYLQGLLTNDVAALGPGQGCYAAYLTPQGRMIADMLVYEVGDAILLSVVPQVASTLLARLDDLVFAEDVQVVDATRQFAQIAVLGPKASEVVAPVVGLDPSTLAAMPEHGCISFTTQGERGVVARITDPGEPGFDLYIPAASRDELTSAIRRAGVAPLDQSAADAIRVEAGAPLFGRDMDEETIPLEAGIEERAISFTKGCYVGQEVIVRVLHRGHGRVARRLMGLRLAGGQPPAAGAAILDDGREVGRVTSGAWSPVLGVPVALGYLSRDAAEPGSPVSIGGVAAVVTALPIVAAA